MTRSRALVAAAVLGMTLLTTATAGVGLALEPASSRVAVGTAVLLGLLAAQGLTLLRRLPGASPAPRPGGRVGRPGWDGAALAALTVASVPLLAPLGVAQGWETWAWVGAGLVGSVPLFVRWQAGIAASAVLTALSAAVGQSVAASPWEYALLTAGAGIALLLIHLVPLRLLRLVAEAQTGRDAAVRLAAAEERLRFAADVHDLLGHHLTVIALAAELAARTAHTDPDAAATHGERARASAATALAEMRRVVHGYRETDLAAQLDAVAQVLRASGLRTSIEIDDRGRPGDDPGTVPALPDDAAAALAAVAREAGTNVLRHGRGRWCTIGLVHTAAGTEFTIANDAADAPGTRPAAVADGTERPGTGAPRHSSGLSGLRTRLADTGGTLHSELCDGVFTVRATVPSR